MAKLFAETTGSDADWVVKLIDAYPGDDREEALAMSGYELIVEPPTSSAGAIARTWRSRGRSHPARCSPMRSRCPRPTTPSAPGTG